MKNITNWYILLGEWAFKLFYLNLLWLMFSLLGLGLLGVFPATVSVYTLLRNVMVKSNKNKKLFKTFWMTYKKEFVKSNVLGYTFIVFGSILYIDLKILQQLNASVLNQSIMVFISILIMLIIVIFIYLFPIYVHYNMRLIDYIKHSFILAIGRPLNTIIILLGLSIILLVYMKVPGLIPAFGIILPSTLIMKIASNSFVDTDLVSE